MPDNPTPVPANTTPTQTLQLPFDWLVHLDRQLISPMELMHVSAFKPHELTQQFMKSLNNNNRAYSFTNEKFQQRAPWLTPDARIFRALEFLSTGDRCAGVIAGGRIPGKININGIWDPETFLALCDAQSSNSFFAQVPPNATSDDNVLTVLQQMMAARSPGYNVLTGVGGPGATDRPFRGIAAPYSNAGPPADGQYPTGIGINDTVLNYNPATNTGAFLLADTTPATHPYQRFELLTKIFNNITTRSNCFAVWCTVGYFQVMDDTTRPVKLGPELGVAQGQNVRQRFFAVVDRTNLTFGYGQTATLSPATAGGAPQNIFVETISGTLGGPTVNTTVPWSMQGGNVIIDLGLPTQEILTIQNIIPGPPNPQIVVTGQAPGGALFFPHQIGATISVPPLQSGPPAIFVNSVAPPVPTKQSTCVYEDPPGSKKFWMNVPSLSGSYDGVSWNIQGNVAALPAPSPASSVLYVDVGNKQEVLAVLATGTDVNGTPRFQANFDQTLDALGNLNTTHATGCVISNTPIGNPGPQPNFSYKNPIYAPVVRYFAILDTTP
jgi:hypothetical protein